MIDLPKLFKSARKDQGLRASLKDVLSWYGIKHDEKRIGNAGELAPETRASTCALTCALLHDRQRRQVHS